MMGRRAANSKEAKYLIEKYSPVPSNEDERAIEAIEGLVARSKTTNQTSQAFLHDVARTIYRVFDFKEIAIGLKDKDGNYRYVAMMGFRDDAESARKKIVYTSADMADTKAWPGTKISKITVIHFSEDDAFKEGEEDTYNRPSMMGMSRPTPESMMEGDYIEMSVNGTNNDLVGWIELSNPKDGKFPPRSTMKWLELTSIVIAAFLKSKDVQKERSTADRTARIGT
jgi:hypothetical protein